jgi:hypothetical protein
MLVYSRPTRAAGVRAFRGACYALLFEAVLWGVAMAAAMVYRAVFHR